jgi:hypothetical protein
MGYVNYLIGVSVVLVGLVLWSRVSTSALWARIVALNVIGALLFFCHLSALVLFVLIVVPYELASTMREASARLSQVARTAAWLAGGLAAPALLTILWERPEGSAAITYSLPSKARLILAPVYTTNAYLTIVSAVVLGLVLYSLLRRRHVDIKPPLIPSLATLLLFSLMLPSAIGYAVELDARMLAFAVLLFVAASRPNRAPSRMDTILAAAVVVVVIVRSLALLVDGLERSRQIEEFRASVTVVPSGSAVLVTESNYVSGCGTVSQSEFPTYWHIPGFVVIDRQAFEPLVFTGRGSQPIEVTEEYAAFDVPASSPVPLGLLQMAEDGADPEGLADLLAEYDLPDFFSDWFLVYDYIIDLHGGCVAGPELQHATVEERGSFFTIYRVDSQIDSGL